MTTEKTTSQEPQDFKSVFASLRRVSPYVKTIRWQIAAGVAATLMANAAGLTIPLVTRSIIDGPITHRDINGLIWFTLVLVALAVVRAINSFARRWIMVRASVRCETAMRVDFFRHVQQLPIAFHDKWASGQLLSRIVGDLTTIQTVLAFVGMYFVVNMVLIVGCLFILGFLSLPIMIIVVVCNLPILLISKKYEGQYKQLSRTAQDQVGDLTSAIEESVLGIRVLKAYGRGEYFHKRFTTRLERLRITELSKIRVAALLAMATRILPAIGVSGVLAYSTWQIVEGNMTIGTLVAALSITAYLQWPFEAFGWLLAYLNTAATATDRYWEVRDAIPTITSPEPHLTLPTQSRSEQLGRQLSFENVHFSYRSDGTTAEKEVLRGVNLVVHPGETVALVGETGSGKTALTALVPRLFDVTGGRVLLDGVDVRDLSFDELRTTVGMAFEEPFLFSASVRENIVLGRTDVTDDQVYAALRVASAEDFVTAMPWGLQTRIGEQGLSLSGGQRQRLALARVVLGKPSVLVLDDPLSALDVNTEAEVETALRQVLQGVTALIVAHRPSTVQLADRVALLEDGCITAVDTHQKLITTNQTYRNLLSLMESTEVAVQ